MEEYYDNRSMDDIDCNSTPSPKLKPKKRSLVERELETSLTSRITSPISNQEATNTSRYGRARKFKNYMSTAKDNNDSKFPIPNIEKSPNQALSAYKMYASNSPTKSQSHRFDNQIENIYNQNISLSRFCSKERSEKSKSKVYIRKDLIQTRDKEETIILIKNMFSPNKNVSNTEMILSSEKINKSHEKDVSSVVKTLDFDGKTKKEIQEKRLPPSDFFEQEAQCEYQVGDLVWARMGTYPFWPSIVTREPISNLFIKKKLFGKLEKNVLHVTFLGDNGRRGWILLSMLRNYSGLQEFVTTRDNFTPEEKRKDHRLYAAFFVTGKRLPLWNLAVDEAEILYNEPKILRIDILNSMLGKSQQQKDISAKSKKVTRTNSDISLSESLYDSLFSEDDCKGSDSELSKNNSRKKSLDVSDVVTACLDNMAAKSGITKIQKQSHMDIWLQKAKSKTPEESQFKQSKSEKKFKPITKLQVPSTDTTDHKKRSIRNESQSITDNNQSHEKEHDYFTRSTCPNSVGSCFNDEIIDSESNFSNPTSIETNDINEQNILFNKDILGISPEILDENCAEIEVITSDDMILESCDTNELILKTDQENHKIAELYGNNLQDQANLNQEKNNIDEKYDEIKHYESKFENNSKSCGDTKCMDISNLIKKSSTNNINITPSIPESNFISSKRIIKIISKKTVEADLLKYRNMNEKEFQTMNTVKEKPSIIIDKSRLISNLLEADKNNLNIIERIDNLKSDSYNNGVEKSRISQNLNTICIHNNNVTKTKPLFPSNLERKTMEENKIHSSEEASIKNLKLYDQGEMENQDLVNKIELTRAIEEKSDEKNKGDEKKDVIILNHLKDDKVSTSQSDNLELYSEDSFDIRFNYDSNNDSDNKNSEKNVTDVESSTVASKPISHDSDIINKIEENPNLTESCEGNNNFQNIQKNVSCLFERDREKETVRSERNKKINIKDQKVESENKKLSRSTNKNIPKKSCDNKLTDDCEDIISNSANASKFNTSSKSKLNNITADELIKKSISLLVEPDCNNFKTMCFDVDQSTISKINSSKSTTSSKNIANLFKSNDVKQQVTCEENHLKNVDFLKYLQQKQDVITDENPDLTYDEVTAYLFKTWKYEQNLNSDKHKLDNTEQSKNDVCCSPKSEKKSKLQPSKSKSNQSLLNFMMRNDSKGIRSTQLQSKNLNKDESAPFHLVQKQENLSKKCENNIYVNRNYVDDSSLSNKKIKSLPVNPLIKQSVNDLHNLNKVKKTFTNDNLRTNIDNKDFEKLSTDKKICESKKDVIEKIKKSDVFISQDIRNKSEQNKSSERQVQKPNTPTSYFDLNLNSDSDDSSYAKRFPKLSLSLYKKQTKPTKNYAKNDFCTDNNTKMSSEEKSLLKNSEPSFDCITNEVEYKTSPNNKEIKNDNYLNHYSSGSAIGDQKVNKGHSNIGSSNNHFIQKVKIDSKNDNESISSEISLDNFQNSDTTELISTKGNSGIALSEPNDKQLRSDMLSKHRLTIKCKGTVLMSDNSDSDSSDRHINNDLDLMSLKERRDIFRQSRKVKSKRKKSKEVTSDTETDYSRISSSTYAEKDFSTDNSIKMSSEEKSLPKNSVSTFDCKANKLEHKISPNNKEIKKDNLNIYTSGSVVVDQKVHQEQSDIESSQNHFISKDKIYLKHDNKSKSNETSFGNFQNSDTTDLISTKGNSGIALSERNDKQLRSNVLSKHRLTIKFKGTVLLSDSDSDFERHISNAPELMSLKKKRDILRHSRKIKSKRKISKNITSDSESDFSSKSSSKDFQHNKSDNILNRLSGSPAKRKVKRKKQLKIEDFIKKPQDDNSSFDSASLNDCEDTNSRSPSISDKKADDDCNVNDLNAGFIKSEESEKVLSKRKARKQTMTTKCMDLENQEFLEYLELRQDQLMDEHPELTQEEITIYLYNTWFFEDSLKSENKKTDALEQRSLVKGLSQDLVAIKKVRKKPEIDKGKDVTNNNELSTKEKSKRRGERHFYREDFSDFDDEKELYQPYKTTSEGEVKDEPSTSKNIVNADEKILTDNIENNYVGYDGVPLQDVTEKFDQVEEYFRRLTEPKPNLFKGLAREKVCEICEKVGNLHKCKGCHGFFHVDCSRKVVEIKESSPPHRGRKKKRKNRGRKPRNLDDSFDNHSDKSQEHDLSFEHEMESHTIADALEFEQKLSSKLKEMIENPVCKYDTNSSEEELNWSDADVGSCKVVEIVPKKKKLESIEFKCKDCEENDTPICFVCKRTTSLKKQIAHRQKCQVAQCYRYFHIECLEHWPQTQCTTSEKEGKEVVESLQCPRHVCHTCVCDDPRGCKTRFSGDKLARCVRCPATYHAFTKCLPAGSQILSGSHIICPRHYEHRPGKVPCHVNTGWCFICALGGTLICCEYCPTSFHAECLNLLQPPEGGYMCEDCETGCLPLYGEMVWVKLGHYRWWPGLILHPSEIPENILAVKHAPGEFVVRFFGQYDHYWVNRGRVFPFQEGDTGRVSSRNSKIDAAFSMAVEHAQRAYEIMKNRSPSNEGDEDIASSLLPPHYVKLKVTKPYGSLVNKKIDIEESSLTQCECDPNVEDPCGLYSHCLNRMLLTECGPICRAGERCRNRAFEKRQYPRMEPYRTSARGWGLRTLEDIRAGQFVIEYVGELIDEVEFQRRMKWMHQVRDENYYFLTLDKERMIDAGPKGNLARFMNHSCDPNCETQKWTVLGDVRVGLFALYDIPAKSELTFNYNLECAGIEKKRCLCGTARCSGFMGAKPKQEEPKKKKVKRTYKKRKRIEISPTNTPPKPKRRQPKNRQLTEIEKDLLIIKSATNISSDSESGINSDSTKRKRREEPTPSAKRVKLVEDQMLLENERIELNDSV